MHGPTPPKPTPAHFTDPYEVAEAVAEVLTMRGYRAYYNGSYMSVIDASQSPHRLVKGPAWHELVEDLSVRLLRGTADDTDMHRAARARARDTYWMLTRGETGKVRFMGIVATHARNCLPEAEQVDLPKPPKRDQEYNTQYCRDQRQLSEDDTVTALTDARAAGLMPEGRYAFTDLWEWWQTYRRTANVRIYHPYAARVGRNRFYNALSRLEDTKVVTHGGRKRYIDVGVA